MSDRQIVKKLFKICTEFILGEKEFHFEDGRK